MSGLSLVDAKVPYGNPQLLPYMHSLSDTTTVSVTSKLDSVATLDINPYSSDSTVHTYEYLADSARRDSLHTVHTSES